MLHLLVASAVGILVTPVLDPPNTLALAGQLEYGSSRHSTYFVGRFGPDAIDSVPEETPPSKSATPTGGDYYYSRYQSGYRTLNGTYRGGARLGVRVVPPYTVVNDMYGVTFLIFGPMPPAFTVHTVDLGAVDLAAVAVTDGETTRVVGLDPGAWATTALADRCGRWWMVEHPGVSWRGCAPVTLSARELGVSVSATATGATLHATNNAEVDHITTGGVLLLMTLFLSVWLYLTRGFDGRDPEHATWRLITVHYGLHTGTVLVLACTNALWNAQTHHAGLYQFDAVDMIGLGPTNHIVALYSYGYVPLVVAPALWFLVCGYAHVTPAGPAHWCSFGVARYAAVTPTAVRFGAVALALLAITLLVFQFAPAPRLIVAYAFVTVAIASSSDRIVQLARETALHRPSMLVYLVWAPKAVVLTTTIAIVPYDVGGTLALAFHSTVVSVAGTLLAYITGRAVQMMHRADTLAVVAFLPLVCFTLLFVMVFGIGGTFMQNTEGQPDMARKMSAVFTLAVFGAAYTT
jgi:hypothetical protein